MAIARYQEAAELWAKAGDVRHQSVAINNIGDAYQALGEGRKALDFYTQALSLKHSLGDRRGEGIVLSNLGSVSDDLGEKQKALDYYEQARQILSGLNDQEALTITLTNLASIFDDLGDYQKALDLYNQALSYWHSKGDAKREAVTLNNVGSLHKALGDHQGALDYYNRALTLRRAAGDRRGEAATLNNIGDLLTESDKNRGLEYLQQALVIQRDLGDRQGLSTTLANLGKISYASGDYRKAIDYYSQSLPLVRDTQDRLGEAATLNNLAVAYRFLGDTDKSLALLDQALQLRRSIFDKAGEASALYNTAYLQRDLGKLEEARANIEKAVAIVENLRTNISSQELRTIYFAKAHSYYQLYVELLMLLNERSPGRGYDAQALGVSERARARGLLEMLKESGADIRQGVDPSLLAKEREAQQRLDLKANYQLKLLMGPHSDEQAATVAREIAALSNEMEQVETQIRQSSPRYAALTQPSPLSLREIQEQVLDSDTLLLEYSLGTQRSYLWAVTNRSIESYSLPKGSEIEALARQAHQVMRHAKTLSPDGPPGQRDFGLSADQSASSASFDALWKLSRTILSPVASSIGRKRLLIVPDGALQFVPFGALPSPVAGTADTAYSPLIREHEIVSAPSASTLAVLRREVNGRKPAPKRVAVIADPVFERTDERLQAKGDVSTSAVKSPVNADAGRDFGLELTTAAKETGVASGDLVIPRLKWTRTEAERILELVPEGERKQALDFNANKASATSPELSQYQYVHFATHGFLNGENPRLSGLIFSTFDERGNPQEGFLRAHEVYNLRLPAELVVLSACQTGLGTEVKGEGLVGLTRGFMYAGAPRVIVSLWSVSDKATSELMALLYRELLNRGQRPAAALRAAQLSLMQEKGREAPFYWAAFTLQGDWK